MVMVRQKLWIIVVAALLIAKLAVAAASTVEVLDKPLQHAVAVGDLAVVEDLLDQGADIESTQYLQRVTPLSTAVSKNNEKMVTLLLTRGANVNHRVGFWHDLSPLYLAVKNGNLTLTRQLVEAGARIDPNRWTKVKEVLSAPINLFRGDVVDLGRPPSLLEAARQSGNEELLTFLKKKGAR